MGLQLNAIIVPFLFLTNNLHANYVLTNSALYPHGIDLLWSTLNQYAHCDENKVDIKMACTTDLEILLPALYTINCALEASVSYFICSQNPFTVNNKSNQKLAENCGWANDFLFGFAKQFLDLAESSKLADQIDKIYQDENVYIANRDYTIANILRKMILTRNILIRINHEFPYQIKDKNQTEKFQWLTNKIAKKLDVHYRNVGNYFESVKSGIIFNAQIRRQRIALQTKHQSRISDIQTQMPQTFGEISKRQSAVIDGQKTRQRDEQSKNGQLLGLLDKYTTIWQWSLTAVLLLMEDKENNPGGEIAGYIGAVIAFETIKICQITIEIKDAIECVKYFSPLFDVEIPEKPVWNKSHKNKPDIVWRKLDDKNDKKVECRFQEFKSTPR